MPKVSDMNVDDALHLVSTIVHADTANSRSQGSAFYYSRLAPQQEGRDGSRKIEGIWLVTNRHVILPSVDGHDVAPARLTFYFRKHAASDTLQWEPVVLKEDELRSRARFHPDPSVDVAAIDVFDAVTTRARDDASFIAPHFLTSDDFASRNKIDVYASSDIVVVGYPRGYCDDENLFPIVKAGIIASRWGASFRGNAYFLIDAKLFPGSSGSVVLSKPSNMFMSGNVPTYSSTAEFAFLGIFSGEPRLQEEPVVVGDLTISESRGFDLGIVWYADLVEEVVSQGIPLSEALRA